MTINIKQEKIIHWHTRAMPERLHAKMRVLAGEKRCSMQQLHAEALEIGLALIEQQVRMGRDN